jgi:hypothetical protein
VVAHVARSEIARSLTALSEAGLTVDLNYPVIRRAGSQLVVTWPNFVSPPNHTQIGYHGSVPEYRRLVLDRQYNCAMVDGSLLQLTFAFDGGDLVSNRFCYYPCPVSLQDIWEPSEISLLDLFDELLIEEFEDMTEAVLGGALPGDGIRLNMRGPVRFEFAQAQQSSSHPASHLHLGGQEVRVPVFGALSVGHFLRFVVRHYYPETWSHSATFQRWPQDVSARSITPEEEQQLFLECRSA